MTAKFRGVSPKVTIEKEYYRQVRRGYVEPYIRSLYAVLLRLGDDASVWDWIYAIDDFTRNWYRDNPMVSSASIAAGAAIGATRGAGGAVERSVLSWLDRTTRSTNASFARDFMRVAKVDIRPVLQMIPMQDFLKEKVGENIDLIKTIPERFHQSLKHKLTIGETDAPLDLAAREKMFRQTGHSADYNLRRITRDQSNKLVGQINQRNQEELGIEYYRWETSDDDRVRDSHRTKDRAVFRWDNPPADTGHPGNDIQCRCIALPEVDIADLKARYGV